MSSSSAVYSVTQRSVLSSSNAGNVPSQLAVADAQAHEQVNAVRLPDWTIFKVHSYNISSRFQATEARMIGNFWGYFGKPLSYVKTTLATFWATFVKKLGYF